MMKFLSALLISACCASALASPVEVPLTASKAEAVTTQDDLAFMTARDSTMNWFARQSDGQLVRIAPGINLPVGTKVVAHWPADRQSLDLPIEYSGATSPLCVVLLAPPHETPLQPLPGRKCLASVIVATPMPTQLPAGFKAVMVFDPMIAATQ